MKPRKSLDDVENEDEVLVGFTRLTAVRGLNGTMNMAMNWMLSGQGSNSDFLDVAQYFVFQETPDCARGKELTSLQSRPSPKIF